MQVKQYSWTKSSISYQAWSHTDFSDASYELHHVRNTHQVMSQPELYMKYQACHENKTQPCYIKEDSESLVNVITKSLNTLEPNWNSAGNCTLLLMSNLVHPKWIPVDCDKKILSTVTCAKEHGRVVNMTLQSGSNDQMCERNEIWNGIKCHYFTQYEKELLPHTKSSSRKQVISTFSTTTQNTIRIIFEAVNIKTLAFIFQKSPTNVTIATYRKSWLGQTFLDIDHSSQKHTSGWLVFESEPRSSILGHIFYKCEKGHYITTSYISDGVTDCVNSAAQYHTCAAASSRYSTEICKPSKSNCFKLFYRDRNGRCRSFIEERIPHNINDQFTCDNGLAIDAVLIDDLVPDCGDSADDEKIYTNIIEHGIIEQCKEPDQLPCTYGHSRCYNFLDICLYRLNEYKQLIPCRTGSHIQECEKFQCNQQFKCPKFYCVPWGYTCDGKWDCPDGHDESRSLCLGRNCINMFKCRNSTTCLNVNDVCDGFEDCPSRDDELMCKLAFLPCLSGCICLNLAISCHNVTIPKTVGLENLPYVSYYISHSKSSDAQRLLGNQNALFLNLSSNILEKICFGIANFNIFQVDISFNLVAKLSTSCFSNLEKVNLIKVDNNNLMIVEPRTFLNISSPLSVDLSHNELNHFGKTVFCKVSHVMHLKLENNPLALIEMDMFAGMSIEHIHTDKYVICCIKPVETKCTSPQTVSNSCSRLFPSKSVQLAFIIISPLILMLNIMFLFWQSFSLKEHTKKSDESSKGAYKLIISFVSAADLLCGIYLLSLWAVDLFYGNMYVVHNTSWKNSFLCTVVFWDIFLFSLLSPVSLSFLSLSRYMVIKYPFVSKFKSRGFVKKCLVFISIGFTFLCSSLPILFKASQASITTGYCFPFMDPTGISIQVKAVTMSLLILHVVCIMFILSTYCLMLKALTLSNKSIGGRSYIGRKMMAQLVVLVASNLLCWLPSSSIYLVLLSPEKYSTELLVWTLVIVMPINSVTDPIVFFAFTRD